MQMLGKFGEKTKLTFPAPSPMFKKRFRDTALCWPRIEPTYFFFKTATLVLGQGT